MIEDIETGAQAVVFDTQDSPSEFPLAIRIKRKVLLRDGFPSRLKDYKLFVVDKPSNWRLVHAGRVPAGFLCD